MSQVPELSALAAETHEITRLLHAYRAGDEEAFNRLYRRVFAQLHQLAAQQLRDEKQPPLQTTELLDQALLKLFGTTPPDWENRRHFFNVAARAMRQVLVDEARKQRAQKRPGLMVSLTDLSPAHLQRWTVVPSDNLLAVDEALTRFAALGARQQRQARVVELVCFIGLTPEDAAECLGIDRATVYRDWKFARAWLSTALQWEDE